MDMDNRALMDSEIFRAFAAHEAQKKREEEEAKDPFKDRVASVCEKVKVVEAWVEFEKKVNSTPYLLSYFKKARATLDEHPELREKVNKKFLMALDSLNLEQEDE